MADRSKLAAFARKLIRTGDRLPPVIRSIAGVLLIVGGVLGIVLPVLGFWMVPLGLAFVALDIPPLRARIKPWLEKTADEA
jgi:hypothetical protein